MKEIKTTSPEETFSFGEELGKSCHGGEVILLLGNLGAGKTCLTQGIARGLGVRGKVNSPTFNIMKIYKIKIGTLCHIDAYRLNSGLDLEKIGIARQKIYILIFRLLANNNYKPKDEYGAI